MSTLRVGSWQEECRFLALPLDDFDMILGIEFLFNLRLWRCLILGAS